MLFSQAQLDKAIDSTFKDQLKPGESGLIAAVTEENASIAAIVENQNGRIQLKAYIEHDWDDKDAIISNAGVQLKVKL